MEGDTPQYYVKVTGGTVNGKSADWLNPGNNTFKPNAKATTTEWTGNTSPNVGNVKYLKKHVYTPKNKTVTITGPTTVTITASDYTDTVTTLETWQYKKKEPVKHYLIQDWLNYGKVTHNKQYQRLAWGWADCGDPNGTIPFPAGRYEYHCIFSGYVQPDSRWDGTRPLWFTPDMHNLDGQIKYSTTIKTDVSSQEVIVTGDLKSMGVQSIVVDQSLDYLAGVQGRVKLTIYYTDGTYTYDWQQI